MNAQREGFIERPPIVDPQQPPPEPPPQLAATNGQAGAQVPVGPVPDHWPVVVKLLKKPIPDNRGVLVNELKFREPTGGDINRYGNPVRVDLNGEIIIDDQKMIRMIAALSGVLPPMIEQIEPRDLA
jgi:hypothetical protein